ncbi:MAG: DMT family transporter [Alphaproteobacteria bacterium]|nr:DMT family transporter [Alphaproteobacteria bacterium]
MNAALFGSVCALGLGSADFMGRFSSRAIGPHNALLGMLLSSAILASLWVWLSGTHLVWDGDKIWWSVLNGIATTVMTLLLYWGLARGPVSVVAPIVAAHPVLVTLFYAAAWGVRPTAIEWTAMAVTLIGAAVVARSAEPEADSEHHDRKFFHVTILIAALSSLAYAVLVIAGQSAAPVFGEIQTLWMGRLFSVTTLMLIFAMQRRAPHMPMRWWPFLAAQGLLDAGGYVALFAGSHGDDAGVAAVTASTFGVVTVLLAWSILRERINALQWLGIVLVFAGIVVLSSHDRLWL